LIDAGTGMAYTNQWRDHTLAIPLRDPHVAARWPNTCTGSRGLALDAAQHTLFVGCQEGKVVALDLDANGRIIASAPVGAGVDIIAWNPLLRHLYAPGAISATMTVLGYDGHGFTARASVPTATHAHCVTTDARHQAYVCDPGAGALLLYRDPR
ncbi:YVTN beta-propeller repeat-containing protein, partial [mine drainage metagenome]